MPQHRCPPAQFRPRIRWLAPAVVLLISSCGTPPKPPPAPPAPPRPFGAAKVISPDKAPLPHTPGSAPVLTFAGANQHGSVEPLWSSHIGSKYTTYGDPLVSTDGRWLVITREKALILFDLQERQAVTERKCPGAIVRVFFDQTNPARIIGVFNSAERPHSYFKQGHATLGFWELPSMEFTSRPLLPEFGPGTNAAMTHRQDRILVIGADSVIGVFGVADGRETLRFDRHKKEISGPHVTRGLGAMAITDDDQIVSSFMGGPSDNGRLRRWRLTNGEEIPTGPEGHDPERTGSSRDMAYTPGNLAVLTAEADLSLTQPENGHAIYNYHEARYHHYVAGSPFVAINFTQSRKFGVIKAQTGQLLFEAANPISPQGKYRECEWTVLSPDNRTVYSATHDHIHAWNFGGEATRPPDLLKSGDGWTSRLAINGNRGQTLEHSAGLETLSRVIEWDLSNRSLITSAPSQPFSLGELRDDKGNTVRWTWTSGSFLLNGNLCTISGREQEAVIFQPLTGRTLLRLGGTGTETDPAAPPGILQIFGRSQLAAAASPDGTTLAIGSTKGSPLTLWDIKTGRFRAALEGHTTDVTSIQYSPDSRRLISGDSHGRTLIRLTKPKLAPGRPPEPDYSRNRGRPLRSGMKPRAGQPPRPEPPVDPESPPPPEWVTLPAVGSYGYISHTSSNRDGTLVAVARATGGPYSDGATGSVTVWQEAPESEWRQLFTYQLPRAPDRIALSPDNRLIAVSQLNLRGKSDPYGISLGDVFVLDAQTGDLRLILTQVDARDLAFLSDRQLATVGDGLRIWTLP